MAIYDHPNFTNDLRSQFKAIRTMTLDQLDAVANDFELSSEVCKAARVEISRRKRAARGLPFGWDIEVEFSKSMFYTPNWEGNWKKSFHYKECTEAAARKRALSHPHAQAVTRVTRIETEDQYRRAFGNWEEKGL
jgi:hypothetical protein